MQGSNLRFCRGTAYIGRGQYKKHLNLTAPLLVLNVSSDKAKLRKMMRLTEEVSAPGGNAYMLYQHIDGFGQAFKPQPPDCSLLNGPWKRGGYPDCVIGEG